MPDGSELPRVAFNAALLSGARNYRAAGIHRYIAGLIGALAERDDVDLTVLSPDREARRLLPRDVRVRDVPRIASRPVGRIAWEQLALPVVLARGKHDLLHGAAYAIPLASPIRSVATIHDLSFFSVPETLPRAKALYLRLATRLAVRRAAALIAVSAFTRQELIEHANADPARVHVIPNGIDPACRPAAPDELAAFRSRSDLPERFVLALGTLEPRKNLGTLIHAYARLRRVMSDPPDLVIAGARGWGAGDRAPLVERLGLATHVRFTGYVPAEDLPLLYSAAAVFAFPSRYEAFGLPVAEAMACGTPVVSSDAASMGEVAGDAALLVGPDDVRGWADALRAVLEDADRAAAAVDAGREQARRFSWQRAARETVAVYRRVLHVEEKSASAMEVPNHGA